MILKPIRKLEKIYWVDENGEVFSFRRNKFLKKWKNDKWYFMVKLQDNWKKFTRKNCRIAAEEWVEWYFEGAEVNHEDWNKENDHISNLKWVTKSQNMQHAWDTGLKKVTDNLRRQASINWRNRCRERRMFSPQQIIEIRAIEWMTLREIWEKFGTDHTVIWNIRRFKTYND